MLQQFESKGKPFSEKMAKNERGDRSNNHVHGLLGGRGGRGKRAYVTHLR